MSHPVGNEHRADKHERHRVSHIAGKHETPKHYAKGGAVHSDEAQNKALIKKSVKKDCMRADGGAVKARADKAPRRANGGQVKDGKRDLKFMMNYDKNAGGDKMRSDMAAAQRISDAVPRGRARGGHVKHGKGSKTNVNVIVAPGGGPKPPMGGLGTPPPPVAAAPPMPPGPPAAPPARAAMAGPGQGPGGMPPMPMRKKGGRVFGDANMRPLSTKNGNLWGDAEKFASGGKVSSANTIGLGARTRVQHSDNKQDTQNIGRGPVITRATGGKLEAYGAKMSPTFPHKAGAGTGVARKAKAHMVHNGKGP